MVSMHTDITVTSRHTLSYFTP